MIFKLRCCHLWLVPGVMSHFYRKKIEIVCRKLFERRSSVKKLEVSSCLYPANLSNYCYVSLSGFISITFYSQIVSMLLLSLFSNLIQIFVIIRILCTLNFHCFPLITFNLSTNSSQLLRKESNLLRTSKQHPCVNKSR